MNFYEADLIRVQNQIKMREEKPDPLSLKCNKIRLETQLRARTTQIEAWRQGKPFTDITPMGSAFFRAMGFIPTGQAGAAQRALEPQKLIEKGRAMGLPADDACEITYFGATMEESGDLPREAIGLCSSASCTGMALQRIFMAHRGKAFSYCFDVPFEANDASLEYLVDQFREFIEWSEKKFPGVIKFDEDRLIELQAKEETSIKYYHEMFEMLKHKPSPLAGSDIFYGGDEGLGDVAYARALRDEMAERIEKGVAAVPGEKLRMFWTVQRPYFMDPFKILAKREVAVIFWYSGLGGNKAPLPQPVYYGGRRKLTPLEKEAARGLSNRFGGRGDRWVNDMMWICRELKIDAIINFNELGCMATLGLKRMVEETAEKELGIPTLQLEGKRWDNSYASEATISAKLDEFALMCLSRKGLA